MHKIIVEGQKTLTGEIKVSGAKNSAVALLPAAILAKNKSVIYNVPEISDIEYLIEITKLLNCDIKYEDGNLYINSTNIKYSEIPESLSLMMRASYYYMGAMLARFGKCEISFPGGCTIGARPIDIHIKGFKALGARVEKIKNKYIIQAEKLIGNKIYLDFPSVGATINIMLAATNASGKTIIENAAREPEIVNVASFLINMGADIKGAGTSKIEIIGNQLLDNGVIEVFPDRIEAGTFVIMGALLGDNLKISGIICEHLESLLMKLDEMKIKYKKNNDNIIISRCNKINPTYIKTLVYPGFPTDLQQPIVTLLTQAEGKSIVDETIYENRFKNTFALNEMGANINIITNNKLEINGKTNLFGKEVTATDLRGGASLLIAGLIAEGKTIINEADYILRGYGNIIEKLKSIGAKIEME